MKTFYHVTETDHTIGTMLQPGSWGNRTRHFRVRTTPADLGNLTTICWETTLELSRQCLAPDAPSRLNCVFATPTLNEARIFRDRFRANAHIFKIEASDDVVVHLADFESITTMKTTGQPFVDAYIEAGLHYWTDASNSPLREAIIGGRVTIVEKL